MTDFYKDHRGSQMGKFCFSFKNGNELKFLIILFPPKRRQKILGNLPLFKPLLVEIIFLCMLFSLATRFSVPNKLIRLSSVNFTARYA